MLRLITRMTLVATLLFVLLTGVALFSVSQPALTVAYTGMCGDALGGTCLRDATHGHAVHWADYGNYVDDWSPDMTRNVYSDPRDYSIRSYNRHNNVVKQLTASFNASQGFAPQLSRDGRYVAYASASAGRTGLRIRVMEIDSRTQLIDIGLENNLRFAGAFYWAPNGERLAVFTRESSGGVNFAPVLWLIDMASGDITYVGTTASPYVTWAPSSTEVAYINSAGSAITVIDAVTGKVSTTHPTQANAPVFVSTPVYSPDGAQILFIAADAIERETFLRTLDVATGEVTTIAGFSGDLRFEGLQWLAGGIYMIEDRLPSSYADEVVIYHIDPATHIITMLDSFFADDYLQVVEW